MSGLVVSKKMSTLAFCIEHGPGEGYARTYKARGDDFRRERTIQPKTATIATQPPTASHKLAPFDGIMLILSENQNDLAPRSVQVGMAGVEAQGYLIYPSLFGKLSIIRSTLRQSFCDELEAT